MNILLCCAWIVIAFIIGWALGSFMTMLSYDEQIQSLRPSPPGDYDEY